MLIMLKHIQLHFPSFATKEVGHGLAVGELPTGTYEGHTLEGWFTDNSWSTQVTETTQITDDVTYIAKWRLVNIVAKIGEEEYESLEEAINAVPTNGTKTTITILQNITTDTTITIPATKNIELDMQQLIFLVDSYMLL